MDGWTDVSIDVGGVDYVGRDACRADYLAISGMTYI